jgi:hypothetical protein
MRIKPKQILHTQFIVRMLHRTLSYPVAKGNGLPDVPAAAMLAAISSQI